MSEFDANEWSPEQAAASGYPVPPPDSSPAEGADGMGAPPAPPGAPAVPAQPDPDHPRFQEVYRNWKDTEREKQELEQRLAQYENLNATHNWMPTGAPPPPPQEQPMPTSAQDDPEAWLKNTVADAVKEHIAPIQQAFTAQQQTQRLAQAAAQFRQAHPEYNDTTDAARLLGTYQKYQGNVPLEDCYRFSFPERYAQGQGAPQGVPAPMADVPASAPDAPQGDSPAALMQRLANPNLTAYERERIGRSVAGRRSMGDGSGRKSTRVQVAPERRV